MGTNETWGKVKQSFYFLVKHVLKYVSLKNKTTVSLYTLFTRALLAHQIFPFKYVL
jgi:hypothetical protein